MVGISWFDAEAYGRWLTDRDRADGLLTSRQSYRLPTFQEFTFAARDLSPSPLAGNLAGIEVQQSRYWHSAWPVPAGINDGFTHTSPTGSFPPSSDGLLDLIGNAAEWCADGYAPTLNDPALVGASPYFRKTVPPESNKVVAGGSWFHEAPEESNPRVALRFPPDHRHPFLGFRLALEHAETPGTPTP